MRSFTTYSFGLIIIFCAACGEKVRTLETETITLQNADQIVALDDSLVRPILYHNIPDLSQLPVDESKQKFIATVLPAVLIAKHHLAIDRDKVKWLADHNDWTTTDSAYYQHQMDRFKASNIQNLLIRMDTHPNSIVLAQAAVESGWGSSRFFRQANNLFGIWAYSAKEPRISADNSDVFLRKYKDISQSIEDYLVTIGRARPYREFRQARAKTKSVDELLPHLKPYSERGRAYTNQLKTIIRQNNLTQYDNYKLDPRYFVEQ